VGWGSLRYYGDNPHTRKEITEMKRKSFLSLLLVFMLAGAVVSPALAQNDVQDQLEEVREVTAPFHNLKAAQAAGFNLVPGLDYCFNNPGVGGMGFHYINVSRLDTVVDFLKPEALVYAPSRTGKLQLVAVEYIVPIGAWNAAHAKPPTLFGQTFELNQTLGVYTLHAWIWRFNPLGVFSDWNPRVSC
jgi:hypothetical protein